MIETIGDLKRELAQFQNEYGFDDNTKLSIPVQSYTQARPIDAFHISVITGGYGGVCLYVNLPEGFIISKRKTER
jgi:hypothetical protein